MDKELRNRLESIENLLRKDIFASISEIKEELQDMREDQKVLSERVNWHEKIAKWAIGIGTPILGALGLKSLVT